MSKISMLVEQFENEKTGETVEGITIFIEGALKDAVDILKSKKNIEQSAEIIYEALMCGMEQLTKNGMS